MNLQSVKKANLKGRRVLLRVGFDVPIKNGKVTEDFRIKKSLPTVRLLQYKSAKVIILSHLGEKRASQKPVANYLNSRLKNFKFIPRLFGPEVEKSIAKMKEGDVIMLENLRINPGEEKNDKNFAKKLAKMGDAYVNEAFSVSHRAHASIVGIPSHLPSFAGLLFENELSNFNKAFKPKHPFLLILGGVKFESKLGILEKFVKIADKIFIGGALANNFFKLKRMNIDKSIIDTKVSVKKYLNNQKIILPIDFITRKGMILDIGPETIKEIMELVKKSKFILWNGPMGNFEDKKFSRGTEMTARIVASSPAISIIGGGDTIAAVTKAGVIEQFSFVSSGGGAMLEFLAKGTLPGLEALAKSKKKL